MSFSLLDVIKRVIGGPKTGAGVLAQESQRRGQPRIGAIAIGPKKKSAPYRPLQQSAKKSGLPAIESLLPQDPGPQIDSLESLLALAGQGGSGGGMSFDQAADYSAIQRALAAIDPSLQQGIQQQRDFGTEGDKRLQTVYDALAAQMEGLKTRTDDLYSNARTQTGAIYDQAAQTQQSAVGQSTDEINKLAAHLGGSGAEPVAQLQEFLGKSMASNANQKGAALAANQQLGTDMSGYALQAVGDSRQQGATARSDLVGAVQKAISELQRNAESTRGDLLGKLTDIEFAKSHSTREGEDPLSTIAKALGIQNQQASLYGKLHPDDKTGAAARPKGQMGLEAFLNSSSPGYWNQAAGPRFRTGIMDLLEKAHTTPGVEPYQAAMAILANQAGSSGLNKDALRTALNIFFGKY